MSEPIQPSAAPIQSRIEVPGTLISDYVLRRPRAEASELILILHGYSLSGKIVYDKLAPYCPEDAVLLAPNGPFPLPERKADGSYRVGFSWYFYDPSQGGRYFIDMRVAIGMLRGMIAGLGLEGLPVRIIGFSQGGYLASLAALELAGVRQVIGIASEFLPEEMDEIVARKGLSWPPEFRADAVHGAQDEVVPIGDARPAHEALLARGMRGRFVELAGEGHRLSAGVLEAVRGALGEG
jgi:predicted esterase